MTDQVFAGKGSMAYSIALSSFAISNNISLVLKKYLSNVLTYKEMLYFYSITGALSFIPVMLLVKRIRSDKEKEMQKDI